MIDAKVKKVVYVAGWNSTKSDFAPIETLLTQTYPNATLARFNWNSSVPWKIALQNAEAAAQKLRARLSTESPNTLRRLALLDHSLGARVAIGATRDGLPTLRQIVLLGAAIDGDSPDVAQAARFSALPIANVYSPFDVALAFYRLAQGRRAFGQRSATGNYALNVPSINGSLSRTTAFSSASSNSVPPSALAAIQNAALQSHCFADYLTTWRDFDPNGGLATVKIASDVAEAAFDMLSRCFIRRS